MGHQPVENGSLCHFGSGRKMRTVKPMATRIIRAADMHISSSNDSGCHRFDRSHLSPTSKVTERSIFDWLVAHNCLPLAIVGLHPPSPVSLCLRASVLQTLRNALNW